MSDTATHDEQKMEHVAYRDVELHLTKAQIVDVMADLDRLAHRLDTLPGASRIEAIRRRAYGRGVLIDEGGPLDDDDEDPMDADEMWPWQSEALAMDES
ncbi:hypothetical protein [Actinomarinicola tropica]|uniref:Uncharacterized protein n=1 Tax=Actinomarinicola tropica TaxID=2789776 RepID=A0A5Q2RMF6_9ACTN|nr:hypothetical protein [Actinomarinicola tropica]QGG95606.1 hypothetical protein GH723_11145 [Actinomarinicola tropica]